MHQTPEVALCSAPWRTHTKSIFDSSRLQPTCTEHIEPNRKSDIRTVQCIWSVLQCYVLPQIIHQMKKKQKQNTPSLQDVFYKAKGCLKLNYEFYFHSHRINMLFPLNLSGFNVIWLKNEWLPFYLFCRTQKKIQLNLKPGFASCITPLLFIQCFI